MNFLNYQKCSVLLFAILLVAFILPATAAGNIEKSYTVQPQSTISRQFSLINIQPRLLSQTHNQKLYVSIPASLINYYGNLTHIVNGDSDYVQFVTPQTVAPIADSILKVTDKLPNSQEQFADAVLALVHQIPYNVTTPKYPVETLAEDTGDCVGLSLLAASIMEAGGLNVVLIHYIDINPQHMNVGVYLPYTPVYHTILMAPTSFTYDDKTYWTAEATPGANWKVGDQSPMLANAQAIVIPLNNSEQPLLQGQVSASLNSNLLPSSITLNPTQQTTSTEVNDERTITISGTITPAIPDQTVTIYVDSSNNNNEAYNFFTAATNNAGDYSLNWNFTTSGAYYLTASWNGASNYAGSDSQTVPVFIGPQSYYQFDAGSYNYIYGQPSLPAFATVPMQGANSFLSLTIGTNVSLSYDFIVLQAGQTISNVQTINVTVPASIERVLTYNGRLQTVNVPAHNETVPVNIPDGLAPLMLPDDFNQTLDNQFCFILQDKSGNYVLNVNGLSQDDLSNMQAYAAITNATSNIKQDTWYHVTTKATGNTSTTNLENSNGTIIENTSTQNSNNQTVLLITNNEDTAIVLKNLTIQTQNSPVQTPQATQKPTSNPLNETIALYVFASFLAAATVALLYARRQRKTQRQTENNQSRVFK